MRRTLVAILILAATATLFPWPVKAQAAHSTTFTWVASSSAGATYNAYKQAGCAGTFVKLNTAPIIAASFTDTGMADGEINCYLFTAVVGTSESAQSQSQVARVVTPITPTITPGAAFVGPPGAITSKPS
jgi:hypothetical protein